LNCEFKKIGYDEMDNKVVECQGCGAISYDDGSLIEDDVKIIDK